jgi:hypothetical protein
LEILSEGGLEIVEGKILVDDDDSVVNPNDQENFL